ncbi:hypothetical protein IQ255_08250 [Pleurocapsales cyanobacterium LEGE 10410]|nr:hypothetical protein [Pleurocapsales cyanobacterium LEGE 10410]
MNETNFSTSNSNCRYCRFYQPQGRRGGCCQMLGVPVQSSWKACTLASSPFETTVKKLENIFQLETPIRLDSSTQLASKESEFDVDSNFSSMIPS